jgi:hypothetical protein
VGLLDLFVIFIRGGKGLIMKNLKSILANFIFSLIKPDLDILIANKYESRLSDIETAYLNSELEKRVSDLEDLYMELETSGPVRFNYLPTVSVIHSGNGHNPEASVPNDSLVKKLPDYLERTLEMVKLGPKRAQEIARVTGLKIISVKSNLYSLQKDGYVIHDEESGLWILKEPNSLLENSSNSAVSVEPAPVSNS